MQHHKTREDRQADAIARQQARDARTSTQQLAIIRQRPGKSEAETARLIELRAQEKVGLA